MLSNALATVQRGGTGAGVFAGVATFVGVGVASIAFGGIDFQPTGSPAAKANQLKDAQRVAALGGGMVGAGFLLGAKNPGFGRGLAYVGVALGLMAAKQYYDFKNGP